MRLLTAAETSMLIDYLVLDCNVAQFATILNNDFDTRPERYTDSPDFRTQLMATFEAAEDENWIKPLLAALSTQLGDDVQAGKFAGDLLYSHTGGTGLQTLLKFSDRYETRLFARKLLLVTGQVCLIKIDAAPAGTGLLVGADQVLTAFHVISKLTSEGKSIEGSEKKLTCEFDFVIEEDATGIRQVSTGKTFAVSDNWLGPCSPPHEKELIQLPPPEDIPIDTLDYALITLAEPVGDSMTIDGLKRGWTVLSRPPKALRRFAWIRIVQYPQGQAQQGAEGRITAIVPNGARLRYYVSTSNTSSGSPCWNFDLNLVAIHNLGGLNTPTGLENQGIPITPIIDHIEKNFPAYKIPAAAINTPQTLSAIVPEKRIWSVGANYPVLDRVNFQTALEEMLPVGGGQLLLVRGSRFSGRTFSLKIAQQFLGRLGHTVVPLSAISLSDASPEIFIAEIRRMLGMPDAVLPAGVDFSTRASFAQRHLLTTFFVDLRSKFALSAGNGPLVWIFIDGLDQAILEKETYDLFAALAQRVGEVPILRLALIGYDQELPPEVDAITVRETISPVTASDVESQIQYLCKLASKSMPDHELKALAERVMASAPAEPSARLQKIAQTVQRIGKKLQMMEELDEE